MFKFLKEKIKAAISSISRKVEEQPKEEFKEEEKKEVIELKEEPKTEEKILEVKEEKPKKKKKESKPEAKIEEKKVEAKEPDIKPEELKVEEIEVKEEQPEEKKGFFAKLKEKITTKITSTTISENQFNKLFEELELALLENNVAYEVIEKIKQDLKSKLVDNPIKRSDVEGIIGRSLKESLEELLNFPKIDLIKLIKEKKERPFVIVFFGTNGVGKTTTIAKIAKLCLDNNLAVVLGAGDSFRKGAIEQLEEWGNRLGIKVIKHQYESDPTAICFDTVLFARTHNIAVVLLDTAGRQHSNINLMSELNKIKRVIKPDFRIFVTESLLGNDAIEQSKTYDEQVGIDGVILTKADVDEKGGTMISIEYVTRKPILYLGTGQKPSDLKEFNKEDILKGLDF